jgi:hypothetical protein
MSWRRVKVTVKKQDQHVILAFDGLAPVWLSKATAEGIAGDIFAACGRPAPPRPRLTLGPAVPSDDDRNQEVIADFRRRWEKWEQSPHVPDPLEILAQGLWAELGWMIAKIERRSVQPTAEPVQ